MSDFFDFDDFDDFGDDWDNDDDWCDDDEDWLPGNNDWLEDNDNSWLDDTIADGPAYYTPDPDEPMSGSDYPDPDTSVNFSTYETSGSLPDNFGETGFVDDAGHDISENHHFDRIDTHFDRIDTHAKPELISNIADGLQEGEHELIVDCDGNIYIMHVNDTAHIEQIAEHGKWLDTSREVDLDEINDHSAYHGRMSADIPGAEAGTANEQAILTQNLMKALVKEALKGVERFKNLKEGADKAQNIARAINHLSEAVEDSNNRSQSRQTHDERVQQSTEQEKTREPENPLLMQGAGATLAVGGIVVAIRSMTQGKWKQALGAITATLGGLFTLSASGDKKHSHKDFGEAVSDTANLVLNFGEFPDNLKGTWRQILDNFRDAPEAQR